MKRKTETIEITYKVFESGEVVTPGSDRCILESGRHYIVDHFVHPSLPFDLDGTVFVEGRKTGVSAEYLIPVTQKQEKTHQKIT